MTEKRLMAKAERALASANMLLASGDSEGACNRAYYAMFNAARALNRAAQLRQIADYRGDPIEDSQVELLVASAASFVEAIRTTFFSSAEQ